MKLTEMNLELSNGLLNWWMKTGTSRADNLKDPDVLYKLMYESPEPPPFYIIPGAVFVLTAIVPGLSGVVYDLGILEGNYDPKLAKKEMIEIAREFELKRLMFVAPSNIPDYGPRLKEIGYHYEGRLKYATIYNAKLSDLDIYGFYTVKPSKRRRRGRRDRKKENSSQIGNGASYSPAEQDSKDREAQRSPSLEGELRA